MEDQGASLPRERFSVEGMPLKKCVIQRCKIWVNSRRLVRGNWHPICTDDHEDTFIRVLAGSNRVPSHGGQSLMDLIKAGRSS